LGLMGERRHREDACRKTRKSERVAADSGCLEGTRAEGKKQKGFLKGGRFHGDREGAESIASEESECNGNKVGRPYCSSKEVKKRETKRVSSLGARWS